MTPQEFARIVSDMRKWQRLYARALFEKRTLKKEDAEKLRTLEERVDRELPIFRDQLNLF